MKGSGTVDIRHVSEVEAKIPLGETRTGVRIMLKWKLRRWVRRCGLD
jgi:hypothetical protein